MALGQEFPVLLEAKAIGHRADSAPLDANLDLDLLAELRGFVVAAAGLDPGPADGPTVVLEVHGGSPVPQHLVLGGLHEDEKAGELDNAADIRVGEFDPTAMDEDGIGFD
jgi:hypothetical protein